MTSDPFDRALAEWLQGQARPHMPAYADDFLGRVARTPQRRRWAILQRWLPVTSARFTPAARLPRASLVLLLLVAGVILAGGLLLLAGQRRVPPPFGPARNGDIAIPDGGAIALVHPDGSGRRTILAAGATAYAPAAWSRDGTRIAVQGETDGKTFLYVVDEDGANLTRVSDGPVPPGTQVTWSPDGQSLAYSSDLANGVPRLFVADTRGAGVNPILPDVAADWPAWSPDGRWLLFRVAAPDGTISLARAHPDGSGFETLYGDCGPTLACGPSDWSPDGSRVAFHGQASPGSGEIMRLHVANADGTGDRVVAETTAGYGAAGSDTYPYWSPDGHRILFYSTREGRTRLFVIDPDGTGPAVGLGPFFERAGVQWSPDSRSILAVYQLAPAGDFQLWNLDPAGGDGQAATFQAADSPAWQRLAP